MKQPTPTSTQNKINFINKEINELNNKLANKEDKSLQVLRIKFITFLDQTIESITVLNNTSVPAFNLYSENQYRSSNLNDVNEYREKYFESEKERIHLQKKITQLLQRQIRQQQHALKLQRAESQSLKEKSRLQTQIRQLNLQIKKLHDELDNRSLKIRDQDKEIHRLATLNLRLHEEKDILVEERNRAERKIMQLIERYDNDDVVVHTKNFRSIEKFSLKNTEGIRNVRTITNVNPQKKNSERYFVITLPVKVQIQKIVYGIRIGTVLPNKDIVYFNEVHVYEKDPMIFEMHGEYLCIEYVKRKERIVLEKQKIPRAQLLISLFGKGDSVMIDQSR